MPFEPEQDERKVAAYVGLPADQKLVRLDTRKLQLPDSDGWHIVLWGVHVKWDWERDGNPTEWEAFYRDPIRVNCRPTDINARITYQLWLTQAYRDDSPIAAERRWHPDLGILDAIVGLHAPGISDGDILATRHGSTLIAGYLEQRRRRWAVLAEVTVDMMVTHFLELEGRYHRRPTQDSLAASYGVARSALTRWLEDQPLTWSQFLARVPPRA